MTPEQQERFESQFHSAIAQEWLDFVTPFAWTRTCQILSEVLRCPVDWTLVDLPAGLPNSRTVEVTIQSTSLTGGNVMFIRALLYAQAAAVRLNVILVTQGPPETQLGRPKPLPPAPPGPTMWDIINEDDDWCSAGG